MMITQCAKCGKEIEKDRSYQYRGNAHCEDCYMDILSPPRACDPWAVHSAKSSLQGKDRFSVLTPRQLNLVNYLREKGEATMEELMENLNLTEETLKREFAVLRHMEILKASKKGDKIFYLLF